MGQESDRSVESDRSNRGRLSPRDRRLRPSGGYRRLRSFRTATVIYDATVQFCGRFVGKRSRMVDQMVQAARSGRQNIAEGSRAATSSSQTELRLVNVARASLDELLLDYEDFLRHRGLDAWSKDHPEAIAVRAVGRNLEHVHSSDLSDPSDRSDRSDSSHYARWLEHDDPEIVANALICLIHQANYLLDRQIDALERAFVSEGGYSERLAAERIRERSRKTFEPSVVGETTDAPSCATCGRPMALRTARKGARTGSQFWGCTGYPQCTETRPLG